MNKTLNTKWGRAKVNSHGYYEITTSKEGNYGKLLHRLIFEDFYGVKIPKGYVIHHIDLNKLNNDIRNLQCVLEKNHIRFHMSGNKNRCNKHHTDETKVKIGKAVTGDKNGMFNSCIKIHKRKRNDNTQGFTWVAEPYTDKGKKPIQSVNLDICIKKVIDFINGPLNTKGYKTYEVVDNT